jgi:uncharacterized protein (DUF427 family)
MATKHFVIDQNGKKHTRTSQGRVYSHCVIVRDVYELALARAQIGTRLNANYISNFNYYVSLAAGTNEHSKPWSWEKPEDAAERIAKQRAKAEKEIAGIATPAQYLEKLIAEDIAAVEKQKAEGKYDEFGVYGWCGRRDLAKKLAAKCRALGHFDIVEIAEAQIA